MFLLARHAGSWLLTVSRDDSDEFSWFHDLIPVDFSELVVLRAVSNECMEGAHPYFALVSLVRL